MDAQLLQTLIVALVIAGAALFMGTKVLRSIRASRKKGCGGDCCG